MTPRLLLQALTLGMVLGHASLAVAMQELSDPTRPKNMVLPVTKVISTQAQAFKLGSILISSQRKVAIINGQNVTIGDQIAGATVRKINKNGVELVSEGRVIFLDLAGHDFKQRK